MGSYPRERPAPLNRHVSEQMKRMPRSSTKPEVALRKLLHARGLRFRLHRRDLPGSPDIVMPGARLAVFVDGCFWHACPEHGVLPKNNRDWWAAKLDDNSERDARKDRQLTELGWFPLHLWEHEDVESMADRVETLWRSRTGRNAG
jgi:DNA mismatch endonuclease (patch repair protein)